MNLQNKTVFKGLFWKFLELFGSHGIQFIVQIILARLLMPSDYGIIALVIIFINIANVFVQSGLGNSLIQKKVVDDIDISSVFYISLSIASILYIVLYILAPSIAVFYGNSTLIPVLRVLALTLFPGAFNSIQNALVSRNMHFKKLFYSTVGAGIVSGTIGIIMAYMGYGIWALVFQQLASKIVITLILWFNLQWRPTRQFSFMKVKLLFSFGWKLLVSSLINTLYMEIRGLIIGKMYSPAMLGYYNRGKQFPQLIISNINGTIQAVLFPVLSSQQDHTARVKSMVRRSIVTSSFIVFPIMVGLIIVAEPLVIVLLTEKWLPAVPFLQILCVSYSLMPIHTANLQAINAVGRSDIFLKLEIVKKIIGIVILFISLPFGIYALALGGVLSSIISSVVNAYPNKKLLDYGYLQQIKDVLPSFFISLIMGVIIYFLKLIEFPILLTMGLQIVVGVVVYVFLAIFLKLECFHYLIENVLIFIKRK